MFPHLLSRRGPGRFVAPGGGGGETDPGIEEQPIVTVTSTGDVSIHGKIKPGSFGKFVFPMATIAANRVYTFRYDPNFAQLTQQGKLAMVGFGLKSGNDFHIVGLRGDGSTGLDKYKVNGTAPNGWNKQTGHTTDDGGAPSNGTQAGPNWIKLITSSDGTTITFYTSADGNTWDEEYAAYTPSPFTNINQVATFGIALWFNNTDTGPFSIVVDQFVEAAAFGVTYIGKIETAGSASGSLDIGAAAGTRRVVMAVPHTRSTAPARSITSGTIGGAPAIIAAQASSAASGAGAGILWLDTAGGGSTAFAVTLSGAPASSAIYVYVITGDEFPDTWDFIASTGNNPSVSIGTPAGGVVIGCASNWGGNTHTWSGLTTEDDDAAVNGGQHSAAHSFGVAESTGDSVSVTSAAGDEAICVVSIGGSLGDYEADHIGTYYEDVSASSTSRQFTSVDTGAADADRLIAVEIAAQFTAAGQTFSGVTITPSGGSPISMTQVVYNSHAIRFCTAGIYVTLVPTGTTGATIDVTSAGTFAKAACAVHRLVGYSPAAYDTDSSDDTAAVTLDYARLGYGIMARSNRTGGVDITWANAIEDFDLITSGNSNVSRYSGAHHQHGAARTGLVVTVPAETQNVLVGATFIPGHRYWHFNITGSDGDSVPLTGIARIALRSSLWGTDLALGKTVTVSSTVAGAASNLVDTDATSYWASTGLPATIRVDLGAGGEANITQFVVQARESYQNQAPTDFTFGWSDDGSTITWVGTVSSSTGWATGEARAFLANGTRSYPHDTLSVFRYFRAAIASSNDTPWISIAEIDYRTVASGADISGGSVSVGPTYAGAGTDMRDDNNSTVWIGNNFPQHITVDWGAGNEKAIVEVVMESRSGFPNQTPASLTFQDSQDGLVFQDSWDPGAQSGWAGTRTFTKP